MTDPFISLPSSTPRDWTSPALFGTVIAYAVLNLLLLALAPSVDNSNAAFIFLGMVIVQPILFGVWTALDVGPVFKRLVVVVPCLLLPIIVPHYLGLATDDVFRRDFIAVASAACSIFGASLAIFWIFRFLRFRLCHQSFQLGNSTAGFQFGIKHLLALTTVYAAAMGLAAGLKFEPEPTISPNFFGPNFVFVIMFFGGAFFSGAALPTVAVPLSILHGRPSRNSIYFSFAIWLFATMALGLLFIDQEGPTTFAVVCLAQLGAIITGALTALVLRYFGLRLIRLPRPEPSSKPQPDQAEN